MDEKTTESKDVGIYRVSFYPGLGNTFSVVRAWRVGTDPSPIRNDPYPSWQLFEGDYERALALFKFLDNETEIKRLCDPMRRNPRISPREEINDY